MEEQAEQNAQIVRINQEQVRIKEQKKYQQIAEDAKILDHLKK